MPTYHIRFGRTLYESLVLPITAPDSTTAEMHAAALLARAQQEGDRFADQHEAMWFKEDENIEVVVIEEA